MIAAPKLLSSVPVLAFWLAYLWLYGFLYLSPVPFGRRARRVLNPLVATTALLLFFLILVVPVFSLVWISQHSLYWDSDLAWWIVDSSPALSFVVSICANTFLVVVRQRMCRETRESRGTLRRCAWFLAVCSLPIAWFQIQLTLSPHGSGGVSTRLLLLLAELFAVSVLLLYLDAMRPLPKAVPRAVSVARAAVLGAVMLAAAAIGILLFSVPNL
jgi:hypothetical protein